MRGREGNGLGGPPEKNLAESAGKNLGASKNQKKIFFNFHASSDALQQIDKIRNIPAQSAGEDIGSRFPDLPLVWERSGPPPGVARPLYKPTLT